MRKERVAILGGGVAGLSAAQELAERGFRVDVYEARRGVGGKARSQKVRGSGRGGRRDLPGEHGFRFFPAFYRHVIDTMRRIPFDDTRSVADNLRPASEAAVALADDKPVTRFLRRLPSGPGELADAILLAFSRLGFKETDALLFTERMLRYYTSCARRRLEQYEGISWWDFLGGDRYSPTFQRHLAAIPRTMVAMDSRRGSARTIGDVSMQLLVDYGRDGDQIDRVLNGPTSDKWIDPWRAYLARLGVRFHLDRAVEELLVEGNRVVGAKIRGRTKPISAEHFVLAVPIEVARNLVSRSVAEVDPSLARLRAMPQARFDRMTNWMNGVQLYLRRDVPIVAGHTFYPDAPWAMTAISQPQFWREDGRFEDRFGDGSAAGLISVDLSDWHTPGAYVTKCARDCSPQEIVDEVWQCLKAGINSRSGDLLRDEDLVGYHIDDELVRRADGAGYESRARLLVHPPGSWADRPSAATAFSNLVLAADYVRTHTDIASMEGANEAARRAVNAILDRAGCAAPRCEVWRLSEPAIFRPARELDERLYASRLTGRRHAFDLTPVRSISSLLRAANGLMANGWRRDDDRAERPAA